MQDLFLLVRRLLAVTGFLCLIWYLIAGCSKQSSLGWPGATLVPTPLVSQLRSPRWSPTGETIAAVGLSYQLSDEKVYVVGITNTLVTTISFGLTTRAPDWSPTGNLLSYSDCEEVSIVDLATSHLLTTIPGCDGAWSPDADSMVVYMPDLPTAGYPGLRLYDWRNGQLISDVFVGAQVETRTYYGGLAWARSGDSIAFSWGYVDSETPVSRDIYTVQPDGSNLHILANTAADEFDPSWSPDGRWLVYIASESPRDGGQEYSIKSTITFTNEEGSCVISALSADYLTGVDWSPSGKELAVTYMDKLYIVDIATAFGDGFSDLDSICSAQNK